jgi:hypothetical protein
VILGVGVFVKVGVILGVGVFVIVGVILGVGCGVDDTDGVVLCPITVPPC